MIKVNKSQQVPDILAGGKAADARKHIENMIQGGQTPKSDDFDSSVFNGNWLRSTQVFFGILLKEKNNNSFAISKKNCIFAEKFINK